MVKNKWTSLIGIAAAVFYIGAKLYKGESITVDDITVAVGLAGLGALSKDFNSHSTAAEVNQATQKELKQ